MSFVHVHARGSRFRANPDPRRLRPPAVRVRDRIPAAVRLVFEVLAILLLICLFTLTSAQLAGAELILNEVLSAPATDWNGDGVVDFKGDEWVEILNTGPGPEDLDGVFLRDGTGDAYHYGFTGQLAPGEVLTVYGHQAVDWQSAQGLSTTGLSLNNSGDRVELWRDIADPRVLDALDAVDVPSHGAAADRSLGRDPDPGTWALFDAMNPYTGTAVPTGTGCAPTPQMPNACIPSVATEAASWGAVKARYGPDRR